MRLIAWTIATFFGLGRLPKAPGTWGTLGAIPLFWFLRETSVAVQLAVLTLILVLGTWAATRVNVETRSADNQKIVIDEVVGYGIALCGITQDWRTILAAFLFFRAFDILKPPPARQFDRWSKASAQPWLGGLGVMMDDVVAGIYAWGCVRLAVVFLY